MLEGAGRFGGRARGGGALVAALLAVVALAFATTARADDVTTPNDPGFAPCESQTLPSNLSSGCHSEQWNLFGALTTP